MRSLIPALALAAFVAAPAYAQDKMSNDDQAAMKQLASANLAEIESGKMAAQKAQNSEVKSFAQKMVQDHTKMLEDLKSLAKSKGVALPTNAPAKEMAQSKLLERKSGAEFDKDYMEHMVKDHEKDVKESENIAAKAKDPQFKSAVQQANAKIREHLQLAQRVAQNAGAGSTSK
jgi:predicted outer membrane protein